VPQRTTQYRRRAFDGAVRKATVALWLALLAGNVSAQVSGTATLVSSYRFRGISLSDDKPAAQLGVTYDDARGWYAGAFASTVQFADPSGTELQAVPFVGYTWRTATGVTWEAGADYSFFSGSDQNRSYPELYVGVASEAISARLYYSNRYFGESAATLYGELNGSQLLLDRVRLLAHVGVLQSTSGDLYYHGPERLFDGRVGIGLDFEPFNVQLSWVGINAASATYPITGTQSRNGPVLTLSWSF
jgi:uncharacterized protein (TIGR02001 family)